MEYMCVTADVSHLKMSALKVEAPNMSDMSVTEDVSHPERFSLEESASRGQHRHFSVGREFREDYDRHILQPRPQRSIAAIAPNSRTSRGPLADLHLRRARHTEVVAAGIRPAATV
eukprot:2128637-Rhodomonas_salina.6